MCTESTLLAYVGNIGWRSKYLRSCNYSADYNLSAKQVPVLGITPPSPHRSFCLSRYLSRTCAISMLHK